MGDNRSAEWAAAKRRAAERIGPTAERVLGEAATRAWGRGWFRRPWEIVADLDEATWRAYRYLGSASEQDHRYLELGVVPHLDPAGDLIGFGVDNGADFMGLHDTSEYGLLRGLEYILKQHRRVRSYPSPAYDHKIRPLSQDD